MAKTPIRFGILGCANIAHKMCRAISLSSNSIVYAIGSRSYEKASKFSQENNLSSSVTIYGSYEEVLDDPNVDAVYVPLPTALHLEWVVLAANKNKHVLLEKPAAMNLAELDNILEACESNGVQFMDATMWMHHPRTTEMRSLLSDAQHFGLLKTIHSSFTYKADTHFLESNIRVKPDLDGLGALGDLGWYCIQAILWATNNELPHTVQAWREPQLNESGVIISCGSSLYWNDGRVATFYCSFLTNLTMDLTALGTKGTLHIHDFAVPFKEDYATYFVGSQFKMPMVSECSVASEVPQEALMVREFSRLVTDIINNSVGTETKWGEISRKTQVVMDAVKASIDAGFKPVEMVN